MNRSNTRRLPLAAFHLLVFCLGVLSMGFQIVASRELAPVFGSSIIVWSFLISTFLIAFSLGSFLGGSVCRDGDAVPPRRWLILGGLALAGFAMNTFLRKPILTLVEDNVESIYIGLGISCAALFLLPVVALSSLGPLCVQFHGWLKEHERSGQSSGIIYGISTLGNIAGVMLTSLFLVPTLTLTSILYLWTGFAFVVLALLYWLVCSARPSVPVSR